MPKTDGDDSGGAGQFHRNLTVAMAWAAMPSRRPVKPMPSVVVALTLTRDRFELQNFRDPRPHGFAVRADLGPLADQRDVAMRG